MKQIYLERYSRPITIQDEAYQFIVSFIEENRVCAHCEQPYTVERFRLNENMCIGCFRLAHSHLTYIGVQGEDHLFRDKDGYLHNVYGETDTAKNIHATLQHWHYPVPEVCIVAGKEKKLEPFYWHMHGDLAQKALILEYKQESPYLRLLFLSYQSDRYSELDRKRGQGRRLLTQARKRIESTKQGNAYYIDEHPLYQIFDNTLYKMMSRIASEESKES